MWAKGVRASKEGILHSQTRHKRAGFLSSIYLAVLFFVLADWAVSKAMPLGLSQYLQHLIKDILPKYS
jgi:hypothetical protein